MASGWTVRFGREFDGEFAALDESVQKELFSHAEALENHGPSLGRPIVDTLRDSAYPNMKEMRFNADDGVWRVAFAFDPDSRGILLVAGNKANLWGKDEKEFYERLIATADSRFEAYLKRLDAANKAAVERAKKVTASAKSSTTPRGGRRK